MYSTSYTFGNSYLEKIIHDDLLLGTNYPEFYTGDYVLRIN
jgi:hypothetical protein